MTVGMTVVMEVEMVLTEVPGQTGAAEVRVVPGVLVGYGGETTAEVVLE
jgi:hypothetical protein